MTDLDCSGKGSACSIENQIPMDTLVVTADGVRWEDSVSGPLLHIKLDAPPVNALTPGMVDAIQTALTVVGPEYRAVVVSSSLPRAFMAGADLDLLIDGALAEQTSYVRSLQSVIAKLKAIPQPIVCAVGGHCLGGGLEFALACDIVVAADDAVLGLPEVKLGILPAAGGIHHLARRIGEARARVMLITGNRVSAIEALAAGVVDIVEPRSELIRRAQDLASELGDLPATAVREIKCLSAVSLDSSVVEGFDVELAAWQRARASSEADNALGAFRRRPRP